MKFYKLQSTNQKSLCKTFVDRASKLHFVENCLELLFEHSTKQITFSSTLECETVLLHEPTQPSAIALKEYVNSTTVNSNVLESLSYGIVIGSLSFAVTTPHQMDDIYSILSSEMPGITRADIPSCCSHFSKLLKVNDYNMSVIYRIGETAVIKDAQDSSLEWVLEISCFILFGPFHNSIACLSTVNIMLPKHPVQQDGSSMILGLARR